MLRVCLLHLGQPNGAGHSRCTWCSKARISVSNVKRYNATTSATRTFFGALPPVLTSLRLDRYNICDISTCI